jgi:hypothetical protein
MRRKYHWVLGLSCLAIAVVSGAPARSAPVTSGSVQFVFNNNSPLFNGGGGPFTMNKWYGSGVDTLTAAQITGGTGGDPIVTPPDLVPEDAVLNGASVVNPAGRARQTTNLDVDFANVLATWGAGEQVGVDAALRTIVSPLFGGGTIVLGDFSLINSSGTLTLKNNFSFPADAFTIGSPVFTDLGSGFSVSGTLLVAPDLSSLTGGFVPTGTPAGTFSMVAVPEPAVAGLVCVGVVGLALARRRSRAQRYAEGDAT